MTNQEMRQMCKDVGVTDDEMYEDPVHGLMLSSSGVRKLAKNRPDTAGKLSLLAAVREAEAKKP